MEIKCTYGKKHCQYNEAFLAEADTSCDEACTYLEEVKARKSPAPSGQAEFDLLAVAKVKKEKTLSGWKQPYVILRVANLEFKRECHTEDAAIKCAEKINKLLASST